MTKKLLGTLSFAALMSAIMVRVFLQLAFGGEHTSVTSIQGSHELTPVAHSSLD